MIARIGRRGGALLLAPLMLASMGLVPAGRSTPPPSPAYSPPAPEPSPFTAPDQFCVRSENRFDAVAAKDPRLRDNPVTVVMLTPAAPDTSDLGGEAETFAALINRCGGVGGRRFDLHLVAGTDDPLADCLNATARFHPLVVVSLTASPAQQCIVRNERTPLVTDSAVSNADLAASSGRLVATASTEGTDEARLLDLVASGRLGGRSVAVVAGTTHSDNQFLTTARAVLLASRIRVVDLHRADTVLVPELDVAAVPLLDAVTAGRRRGQPLDVYGFSTATQGTLDRVDHFAVGTPTSLHSTNLFAFAPESDRSYRASRAPNTFSDMCNQAYATAVAKAGSSPTTAVPTESPLSAAYLQIADVCLTMRIVARGMFAAGVDADATLLTGALHRLPYVDAAVPGGTPKPRPNQVVTEPVKRIEQVIVLSQVRTPCPSSASSGNGGGSSCWVPVSGWDDGGRVVNVPLAPGAGRTGRQRASPHGL
jgi:hypothetical protein